MKAMIIKHYFVQTTEAKIRNIIAKINKQIEDICRVSIYVIKKIANEIY